MAKQKITLDHIPREHHQGVGLVANSWAYLEGAVERIIWRLARLNDDRGLSLTTHMTMPARIQAMNALADLEFPDEPITKRLREIGKHISGEEMSGARNEIIHSRILDLPHVAEAIRITYKARGKLKKEPKLPKISEYLELSERIVDCASELREIVWKINDLVEKKDGTLS